MLLSTAALVLAARILVRSDYRLPLLARARPRARPRAARPCLDALDVRCRRPRARRRRRHAARTSVAGSPARSRSSPRSRSSSRRLVRAPAAALRQRALRPAAPRRSPCGRAARSGSSSAPGSRRSSRRPIGRPSRTRSSRSRTPRPGATTSASGGGSPSAARRRPARGASSWPCRSSACRSRSWRSPAGSRFSALAVRHPGRSVERQLVALLPLAALVGVLYFATSYPTADGDTVKGSFMLTAVPAWAACFGFAFDGLRDAVPAILGRLPGRPRRARARRRPVPPRGGPAVTRAGAQPTNGGTSASRAPSVGRPRRRAARRVARLSLRPRRADGARADREVPPPREAAPGRLDRGTIRSRARRAAARS